MIMIKNLDDIIVAAKSKGKKRLVVAYAQDSHTLEAVNDACEAGLVEATLLGNPEKIAEICAEQGIDINQFTIIAQDSDVECVKEAVKLVSQGDGDILMKGLVSTDVYMRGILSKEHGLLPPKGVLSHVVVFQIPTYNKLLIVSDVAIIPYPEMNQKVAIVKYLTKTANSLGISTPKIACIAPSEQLLAGIQSSTDAAIISKMGDRGQLGNIQIDGPLALDVALNPEIAKIKGLKSSVAGDADALLFPNIDAANVFFKAATQLCRAELAAMVVGTKVPCVLTSRGDSRKSKLYSIALAVLSAK